jgi:4'-phosphopantetheinyl transferase
LLLKRMAYLLNGRQKYLKNQYRQFIISYFCRGNSTKLTGMPFHLEIDLYDGIKAGVWKITETADELLGCIHLNNSEADLYASFHHELRKKQWLACRILLKQMIESSYENIYYNRHGKPYLPSGSYQISLSHSGQFAAVACSDKYAVGIDIEKVKDRVERVKEKFLRHSELESITTENRLEQLFIFWGGKEALYKLNGEPDVDFRNDIHIHPFDYLCNTGHYCQAALSSSGNVKDYTLFYQKIEDSMLVVAF